MRQAYIAGADYPVEAFNAGTWYSEVVADHEIIATAAGMMQSGYLRQTDKLRNTLGGDTTQHFGYFHVAVQADGQ